MSTKKIIIPMIIIRIATILCLFIFTNRVLAEESFTFNKEKLFKAQSKMEFALDGIVAIEELLDNPERLQKYYEAVNEYYQNKLNRTIFDIIIGQMRILSKENPSFGAQLLRDQRNLKTYSIVSEIKTSGKTLNSKIWNQKKNEFFEIKNHEIPVLSDLKNSFEILSGEIIDFENSLLSESKKKADVKRSQFYNLIKVSYNELFRNLLHTIYYQNADIQNLANSNDADLVMFLFEHAIENKFQQLDLPENTWSLIKSEVPKLAELIDLRIFEQNYYMNQRGLKIEVEPIAATTYNFIPFVRPLHAVWKGIWINECVGGANDRPTPRRWATVALDHVNNYVIEKNSHFVGFIQEVGMKKKNKSAIYYATEFGFPDLRGDILILNAKTLLPTKISMLEKWFEVAPKNILRIKSESSAANNAGVIPVLKESPKWNLRISKGLAIDYELADQRLADEIIRISEIHDFNPYADYGTGMISDATVTGANELKTLVSIKYTNQNFVKIMTNIAPSYDFYSQIVYQQPELLKNLNIDDFLEKLFSKMRYSKPFEFYKILCSLENQTHKKSYYEDLLLNQNFSTLYDKILFIETLRGKNEALIFASKAPLTYLEVRNIFDHFASSMVSINRDLSALIRRRIVAEKNAACYPAVVEFILLGSPGDEFRVKLLALIGELSLDHRDSLLVMLPSFIKEFWSYKPQMQVSIFELYKKFGLLEKLRKEVSDFKDFYVANNSFSKEFLMLILADAIEVKDTDFLSKTFKAKRNILHFNSDHYSVSILNYVVTEIIKSEDLNLMVLLTTDAFFMYAKNIEYLEIHLSKEAKIWYNLAIIDTENGKNLVQNIVQNYTQFKASNKTTSLPITNASRNKPMSCQLIAF